MGPNSLFTLQTGKRNNMKPNSLFPGMQGKRAIVLKPNGLFSLTKRSETAVPAMYYDYDYDDGYSPYWGMPHGLFGAYKRSQDTSEDEIIDIEKPEKRDNTMFWATRGKKQDGTFWATRGKKSDDFWAVRG